MHLINFIRSWVLVYISFAHGRTDGQTFLEKVLFFSDDQGYIYMSIPISTISQISPPFWPKLVYLFIPIGKKVTNFGLNGCEIWKIIEIGIDMYIYPWSGRKKKTFSKNVCPSVRNCQNFDPNARRFTMLAPNEIFNDFAKSREPFDEIGTFYFKSMD